MVSSKWLVLTLCGLTAAAACGGRTSDLLSDEGFGGEPGLGGADSVGGTVGKGGSGGGKGGTAGKGGSGGRGGSGGGGGFGAVGAAGGGPNGGFGGGFGGFAGGGFGGFGGFAGGGPNGGFGGFSGGLNCGSSNCYDISGENFVFDACCTAASANGCGYFSDGRSPLQFDGCVAPQPFGTYDPGCPGYSSAEPGCCTSTGVCGADLSSYGLGCMQVASSSGFKCTGFPNTGGFSGTGGFPNTGGSVGGAGGFGGFPSGGFGAVGGTAGAGGAVIDQCVTQSRSDCERCTCKSCFDESVACSKDAGCPLILQCANQTGCTGADCLSDSTCNAVIQKAGGLSSSAVGFALTVFACLQSSGCPCGFKHP